jgi:hypothetical protein
MDRIESPSGRSDPRAAEAEEWDRMLGEELREEWNRAHKVDLSDDWDRLLQKVNGQFDEGWDVEFTGDWTLPPFPGV